MGKYASLPLDLITATLWNLMSTTLAVAPMRSADQLCVGWLVCHVCHFVNFGILCQG